MHCYRITKYNPKHRDCDGHYTIDDWTSISDVGKLFNSKKLSFHSYKLCEDAYINAIDLLLKTNEIPFLEIVDLEKYGFKSYADLDNKNPKDCYDNASSGQLIHLDDINLFARLILREMAWCKLLHGDFFIHFGYDYYMYVGGVNELKEELITINKSGLFVEKMESPYFLC